MKFAIWLEATSPKFFSYDSISKTMWKEKLDKAQKESKIHFDTENDEAVSQRSITIEQSFWEFSKCRFRCEMRKACGDWQQSVVYFRCQLVSGYAEGLSQFNDPYCCIIPGKNDGNQHLEKNKENWMPPDSYSKEKPNEQKCWTFLKKKLKGMVDAEIKKVKSN